jgi:very-short-patch-repair endonuclease
MIIIKASKHNNFCYNKKLQSIAKANKKKMTKSAASIWKYVLSKNQMMGYQFRRERPILNYIVDFVCLELMLIIEVDGITHENEKAHKRDVLRDQNLMNIGFTVLRFSSWEVLNRIADVSIIIGDWININAKVKPRKSISNFIGD